MEHWIYEELFEKYANDDEMSKKLKSLYLQLEGDLEEENDSVTDK